METNSRGSRVGVAYILLYLLVLAIFSESEALTNNGVVIPFIKFSPAYILLAILGVSMICLMFRQSFKVDTLALLLFGRIVLCAIPAMLTDVPKSYLGNFIVACFPLLIYIFFLSWEVKISAASKVFLIFGLIVALQCIWAYIIIRSNGYAEYMDDYYKNFFVIPVGATNNISAILLPIIIFGDQTIEKKPIRIIYTALLLVALFLCKSRTGVILSITYMIVRLFTKKRGKHSVAKMLILILLPPVILLIITILKTTGLLDSIIAFFWGYAEVGDGSDALFSRRFDLFVGVLEKVSEHWIFGNGVTYEQLNYLRTHNVILQMLYENGIFGAVGFFMFLYIAINRIVEAKARNKYFYAFAVSAPFVFINAMVEETMLGNFMVLYGLFFLANMNKEDDCEELENVQG